MSAAQLTLDLGLILPIVSPAQFKIAFVLRTQATERTAERPPRAQMSHRGLARATGLGENTVLRALRGFDRSVVAPVEGSGGPASETAYDLHFAGAPVEDGGAAKMAAEGAAKMEAPPNANRTEIRGAAKMEAPSATENQHVTATQPAATPHDIADGQDNVSRTRSNAPTFDSSTSTSTLRVKSNNAQERAVEGSTSTAPANPSLKENQNRQRATLWELRTSFPAEIASIRDALIQNCRELAAILPIGPERGQDPVDAQMYQETCWAHSCDVGAVLEAIADASTARARQATEAAAAGRTFAPLRSWGWWRESVLKNLGLVRFPPQRESHRAEAEKVAVGQNPNQEQPMNGKQLPDEQNLNSQAITSGIRREFDFKHFWEVFKKSGKELSFLDMTLAAAEWRRHEADAERICIWIGEQFAGPWRSPQFTPLPVKALESQGWKRIAQPRTLPVRNSKRDDLIADRNEVLQMAKWMNNKPRGTP